MMARSVLASVLTAGAAAVDMVPSKEADLPRPLESYFTSTLGLASPSFFDSRPPTDSGDR
jgi:hypothetical protein